MLTEQRSRLPHARSMEILQVHNGYRHAGGEDVVVEREAEVLRKAGHTVTQHRTSNPTGNLNAALGLLLAPWNPWSHNAVRSASETHQPEVAHIHNTWFKLSPAVIDALARRGVPVVMSLHNYRLFCVNGLLLREGLPCDLCVGNGPASGIRYRCYRDSLLASTSAAVTQSLNRSKQTFDQVSVFLANSAFARDQHVAAGFDPDKIQIKPNFVPDPGPRERPPESSNVILYVGRLSSEKGIEFLAQLWRRFRTEGLELRVVGGGPLLERLSREYPDIEFMGDRSNAEVSAEMLSARALLFPSLAYESNPLAIIEAFASGLPVLASDRGAMAEMVAPLGREWLRQPLDFDDWRAGLEIIADDAKVASAGLATRRAYEGSYTDEIALAQLQGAYRKALS